MIVARRYVSQTNDRAPVCAVGLVKGIERQTGAPDGKRNPHIINARTGKLARTTRADN
ncbi:MAG: hypothetical protein ACLQPD_07405 [Desulfomonilaceae bacterium]